MNNSKENDNASKHIRSYVRREGRFTPAQQQALADSWPEFGVDASNVALDFARLFGNNNPVVCEIGFGNGDNLLAACQAEPQRNFLGIEVHRPGAGRLIRHAAALGLSNLRVMTEDAMQILQQQIPDNSLAAVWLFFPDPWHKKKHNKRRIVRPEFAQLVASKLGQGGEFQLATDWAEYAEQMLEVLDANSSFSNTAGAGQYLPPLQNRIQTHFEQRGMRRGHRIFDLLYTKTATPNAAKPDTRTSE